MAEANAVEQAVLYEVKDSTAIITMNRPGSLNSMSLPLVQGVIKGLEQAEADGQVRVVVLTGAGRAFSAGGDLPSLDELHTIEQRQDFIRQVGGMVKSIQAAKKPVIAMVNGVAAGAGFNLALACDLIYAAAGVKFIQSFVNVGLSPDCGGFYYLAKAVGLAKAKELMLTAAPLPAEEAAALGMLNGVYPAEELSAQVLKVAGTIAAKAPLAVRKTKEAVNNYFADLDATLDFEAITSAELLGTEDFKEGVIAFKEKRVPVFTGK